MGGQEEEVREVIKTRVFRELGVLYSSEKSLFAEDLGVTARPMPHGIRQGGIHAKFREGIQRRLKGWHPCHKKGTGTFSID